MKLYGISMSSTVVLFSVDDSKYGKVREINLASNLAMNENNTVAKDYCIRWLYCEIIVRIVYRNSWRSSLNKTCLVDQ